MQELIIIEKENILTTFSGNGLDPIIQKIKDEVNSFIPDLSTEKGRADIASLAYKVSKSKTYLDNLGKDLTTDWAAKVKSVNNSRKKMREELDALRDDVRKPLTDYENKEKDRIENHKVNILKIREFKNIDVTNLDSSAIRLLLNELSDTKVEGMFDEFEERAIEDKDESIASLESKLNKQVAFEEQLAENERLKKEAEERAQKDKEERIAREAKEKAEREAEEKAKLEKERVENERIAAEKKAEKEKVDAENKARTEKEAVEKREKEALDAKEKAIKAVKDAEKRAELEKKAAKEKADLEKAEAVESEKKRQAEEIKKEEDRKRKLEEDEKHRGKIHKVIIDELMLRGISHNDAEIVVEATCNDDVPHLRVEY